MASTVRSHLPAAITCLALSATAAACAVHPYYPSVQMWVENHTTEELVLAISWLSGARGIDQQFQLPPVVSPGVWVSFPIALSEPGRDNPATADVYLSTADCRLLYWGQLKDGLYAPAGSAVT